jgi:hypothetical protein
MHPHYPPTSDQRQKAFDVLHGHPERLVEEAMIDWRSAQRKMTSAVDDLFGVDEEADSSSIRIAGNRKRFDDDQAASIRWTVEQEREAKDKRDVAELAEELGNPKLQLGLHHPSEKESHLHSVLVHPRRVSVALHATTPLAPRPWVSVEWLVANRIREETKSMPQMDHSTEYVHKRES